MNQHNLPRTTQNLRLSDIFTIAQSVKISGVKMRTLYRRIETGVIKPILLADKFFLDRQTVYKLKSGKI